MFLRYTLNRNVLLTALCVSMGLCASATASEALNRPIEQQQSISFGTTETVLKIGQNSFTEQQVREHLRGNGFDNVKRILLDDNGIWRALVDHEGHDYLISVDYSGKIVVEN
ncbi:hypothetical protein [Bartonella sp. LJL80]